MRDIKAHTGLRGIAALAVFLGHAEFDHFWPGAPLLAGIYRFFYWQNPAVDLFFMLSGFVLNYVYLKRRRLEWRDYIMARIARICPLYYMGLFAMLGMNEIASRFLHRPSYNFHAGLIISNLLMVQEWPVIGPFNSIDTPSWSISVEIFLYAIIFPALVYLIASKPSKKMLWGLLICALAVNSLFSRDFPNPIVFQYSGLMRGISGFSAGFLICELICGREERLIPWQGEIILATMTGIILFFDVLHPFAAIAFAALITITYSPQSYLGRLLGSALPAYLGLLSYSVYIWQAPVIKACTLLFSIRQMGATGFDPHLSVITRLCYCIGTTLVLAIVSNISYFGIEAPLRRIIHPPKSTGRQAKESSPQVRAGINNP